MNKFFVVLAVAVASTEALILGGPVHASCKVEWDVGQDCSTAQASVASKIQELNGPDGCTSGGEKCLYVLKSNEGNKITATHETPKHHYIDDLTFNFVDHGTAGMCTIKAYSTSEIWYAHLDYSTNYCNLFNIVDGSGLTSSTGFVERTSDSICTQRSSADCNTY